MNYKYQILKELLIMLNKEYNQLLNNEILTYNNLISKIDDFLYDKKQNKENKNFNWLDIHNRIKGYVKETWLQDNEKMLSKVICNFLINSNIVVQEHKWECDVCNHTILNFKEGIPSKQQVKDMLDYEYDIEHSSDGFVQYMKYQNTGFENEPISIIYYRLDKKGDEFYCGKCGKLININNFKNNIKTLNNYYLV